MRLGGDHRVDGRLAPVEVRGQHFDDSGGVQGAHRLDRASEMVRAAVRHVVPGNGGDDDMPEPQAVGGVGHSGRFVRFQGKRFGGCHRAETASTRAAVAADHESGGALAPAFPMIRARGALAHGVEPEFV